jgi:UDP-glucose 4-epimerase
VINKFMFDAQFENRITINGDGNQFRSFIEIKQAVAYLAAMINVDLPSGNYNLVDKNLSILDIVETIKELYPNLEMIFVNQHLKMREIKVEKDQRILDLLPSEEKSLKEELNEFKDMFTF